MSAIEERSYFWRCPRASEAGLDSEVEIVSVRLRLPQNMQEPGRGVEHTNWRPEDCSEKDCGCGVWDGSGSPDWAKCAHEGLRAKAARRRGR